MSHPPPPHPVTQWQVSGAETEGGEWLSNPQAEALGKYNRKKGIRKSPLLDNKRSWPFPPGLKCGGTRERRLRGPSPNLLTPAPKEIRLLMSISPPLQHAWDCLLTSTSSILLFLPPRRIKLAHLSPPTLDVGMIPNLPLRASLVAHLSCPAPPVLPESTTAFSQLFPSPPDPLALPASSPVRPVGAVGGSGQDLRGGRAGRPELTMAKPESRAEVRLEALSLARLK